MRNIDGYICVAELDIDSVIPRRVLFGPNVGHGQGLFENLTTNDFATYSNKKIARKARTPLRMHQDFKCVGLARLVMSISETKEELSFFRDRTDIVVIKSSNDYLLVKELVGPTSEGYELGTPLVNTNFKTFKPDKNDCRTPYQQAIAVGAEINRQAELLFQLGSFKLDYIE